VLHDGMFLSSLLDDHLYNLIHLRHNLIHFPLRREILIISDLGFFCYFYLIVT
jgi:hypothetical protein